MRGVKRAGIIFGRAIDTPEQVHAPRGQSDAAGPGYPPSLRRIDAQESADRFLDLVDRHE
jgi:hypothetical protein